MNFEEQKPTHLPIPGDDLEGKNQEAQPVPVEIGGVRYFEVQRFPVGDDRFLGVYRRTEAAEPFAKLHIAIENGEREPVFDFGQFAPLFESDNGTFYKVWTKGRDYIALNSTEIASDPRELAGLLHEIGHVLTDQDLKKNAPAELLRRGIAHRDNQKKSRSNSPKTLPGTRQAIVQDERDAWAKGIRLARNLKRDRGVDLLQFFKTPDEFFVWMRLRALRSYEIASEREGTYAITGNRRVEQWIFDHPERFSELLKNKAVLDIASEDIALRTAQRAEAAQFSQYVKETYPDLYHEAEKIGWGSDSDAEAD